MDHKEYEVVIYSELKEREEKIRQIERDTYDISECFKSLAVLIEEQGEIVDNIENSIVKSSQQVEEGKENLEKAKDNMPWFGFLGRIYRVYKFFN